MNRTNVSDLIDGDQLDAVLLVRDKQLRTNRNGNPYLQMDLMDRSGVINARYWNCTDSEARSFETGDYLEVRGKVQLFQGQTQAILTGFFRRDPITVDRTQFLPTTPFPISQLLDDLREQLGKVSAPPLRALAEAFLGDAAFMDRLSLVPAGVRFHHATIGGLLEHTVTMLKLYDRVADLYPDLDGDLMRLGIFLHDVGKVRELSVERDFSYTDEGQLLGHLQLGLEILLQKVFEAEAIYGEPLPAEPLMQLKHLIISHHGTPQYGSPRAPMTAEAVALFHLDSLDSQLANVLGVMKEDNNRGSAWTPYDPKADRRLYKGPPKELPPNAVPAAPRGWGGPSFR